MSPTPDRTADDPQQTIADLMRQLAERTAERDEASRRLEQRTAERDEASAREAAAAEVLGVINSSPGNLAPVFDAMLERAVRLCELDFALLWTYDGSAFHPVARHRVPDPFWAFLQDHTPPALDGLVGGECLVHIADVQAEAIAQTDFGREVRKRGLGTVHSVLVVPLRKGEVLLGAINSYRQEVQPFADKQIALLQNFAAQAVIAMENARLITETREALEQQTATAEVLGVINSSPGDLAPVFNAMLERAVRLCEFDLASLWTYDGSAFHPAARHLVPDPLWAYLQDHTPPTFARLVDGDRLVHIADVHQEAIYQTDYGREVRRLGLDTVRSLLIVPMRREKVLLGLITAYRHEVRPFTEKQITLLENFAAQAVIAMENARLISETREALEQQTATAEVLAVINSSPGDLAPVFDAILEKAHRLCESDFGAMQLERGGKFLSVAARGLDQSLVELLRQPFDPVPGSPPSRLLGGERVVHIADMSELARHASGDARAQAVAEHGFRTGLFVPLRRDTDLLGYIVAFRREVRLYSDKQIALLQNFAAQAVIAMENARLITETREALEQQTATSEVLGVINSSPGDLGPVFDAILEKARSLCGAVHGALVSYDGEHFRAVATHGLPEPLEGLLRTPFRPNPVHQALLRGERLIHVADQAAVETDTSIGRASVGAGARTLLLVPLRKDGALLGYITASRWEVRPFSDKEIALLENFAAQAVIAIENARLITETREALEQQTATAEVLQVINSSPGDLAPVFDAMLEKAMRLCEAAFGYLMTYDGERVETVAHHGLPAGFAEYLPRMHQPSPSGLYARVLAGAPFAHADDLKEGEVYRTSRLRQALVDIGGARTGIVVALRKDETVLGIITIYRQEVRPFTDKQIALLQNFAAQAVIAMENARLITETHEALEQQTATAEVLGVINSSPGDLAPVFDAMLDKAISLCEASFGILWTYDGEYMHASAITGVPPQFAEFLKQGPHRPARTMQQALLTGEPFGQIADLIKTEGYQSGEALPRAGADLGGVRTLLGVTLRKDDTVLGVFGIYRQEVRPFSDKQIALLQNFAAQAVIAIENARLISETREALEQQTATADVLGVINSSPGDLAPVFDAMLEKAMRLCGFDHGSLQTYDGQLFRAVAVRGLPEQLAEELRRGYRPELWPPTRPLVDGARLVHIHDLTQEQQVEGVRLAVASGSRTLLFIPLRKDDALLGTIVAVRQEVRPFTDKQIALLQNFAAQAVIAMENARLINETHEALDRQTATAEVLQVINSSPGDLAPVFEAILEKAHTLCGVASGALQLYDGEKFRAVATNGLPERLAEWLRDGWPPGSSQQRVVAGEADVIHIADLAASDSPRARYVAEIGGVRTLLYVALRKDQKLLGVISASRFEVRPFSEKEIALLQNFAAQAVIAMENARLLGELRQRTEEVGELNRDLEARVATQVDELGRVGRLKRFLAPQLAELIVSQGDEKILESHRREIVVVFCDLRGYTAFTETAEPEEVLEFLRQYHGALGPLVSQYEGTLDQFSGDGIMVFFNDPLPCPDPAERAVKMAIAMREAARELIAAWSRHGCELGFGVGIAQGFATLGQIGFSERSGYTAIGTVCNLAARLCAEAKDGQILVSSRIAEAVEAVARLEDLGNLDLKGLRRPVAAFNVAQSTNPAEARPNLTVVARDTPR